MNSSRTASDRVAVLREARNALVEVWRLAKSGDGKRWWSVTAEDVRKNTSGWSRGAAMLAALCCRGAVRSAAGKGSRQSAEMEDGERREELDRSG